MKERSVGQRSAACTTCGKTFARSDTLLRHEKSHQSTEDRGPIHRVTNGTFRACSACAAARARCSGGIPCGRCNMRKLECTYPNKRRKGGHESQVLSRDAPSADQQTADLQFAEQSSSHEPTNQAQAMAFNAGTGPSFSQLISLPNQVQQASNQQYGQTPVSAQFQSDFNSTPFDYSAFEEPMNWIPISVYPSPYENEFEHDLSFLFPTLTDTSTMNLDYNNIPIEPPDPVYKVPDAVIQADSRPVSVPLVGPGQSPASSASNEHLANKSTTSSAATGDGKRRRRKSSHVPDLFTRPRNQRVDFTFPDIASVDSAMICESTRKYCSEDCYHVIHNAFRKLCVESSLSQSFESSRFPNFTTLNACVNLYFENFHSTFPLLHKPTFDRRTDWILGLAAAAIGSTFVKDGYAVDLREAFQEFLRRAIDHSTDDAADSNLELRLAQARVLNLIGLTQSDRDQLRLLAPRYHADLSRWCLESGVLQVSETGEVDVVESSHPIDSGPEWDDWIHMESRRRVGYFIWLLDTSLAYLANCRPLCNMDDARTPLPCPESLWSAMDADNWKSRYRATGKSPSLCAALEHLYAKKAIDPQLSDISQILLVNALFQRTWEVGTHIKQPLSEWVPTGKARGFLNTPTKDSFWLPLYPLYANWRNSACDCIDVINWQAASIVAKASGAEHHLMLHLHLARIVLLTPFQEIQDLLFSLIGRVAHASRATFYVHDGSYQPRNLAKLPQIRRITWRWLREDQHKARLAIVHAGSVFWHVRRYSSMSFYEPLAVYLASMVLWTYGSYKSAALERDAAAHANGKAVGGPSGPDADLSTVQPSRVEQGVRRTSTQQVRRTEQAPKELPSTERHPSDASPRQYTPNSPGSPSASASSDSESGSNSLPQFIHLDRPCDDEMVQHFVRNGHHMSGHMANVGDICKTPNKVLLEGAKLLRTRLGCWGVSREYYDVLMGLYERK